MACGFDRNGLDRIGGVIPADYHKDHVYFGYLDFVRAGWVAASCAFAQELASIPPSGKNWRAGGMRLLDLAQVDQDLAAWISGQTA